MKRRSKLKLLFILFIVSMSSLAVFIYFKNRKITFKDLYNLDTVSKEFMDTYFEEYSNMVSESPEKKDNILIVTSLKDIKDNHGASKVVSGPNHQYFLQYDSKEEKDNALNEFNNDKNIYLAEENNVYKIEDTFDIEEGNINTIDYGVFNNWGVSAIGMDRAIYEANQKSLDEVIVAVIDTGLSVSLFNTYYSGKLAATYNVLDGSTTSMYDDNGHGTHVSGIVADASPSNVKLLNIKISADGYMYESDIITAINYANNFEGVQVINMSFGGYNTWNSSTQNALLAGTNKNIINIASAGNDNTSTSHYPSNYNNVISIAALDNRLQKSSYSNYGPYIDFATPGDKILSLLGPDSKLARENGITSGWAYMSGTSMAAPLASATVAMLKSYNKNLTYDQVNELLISHSIDKGNPGRDDFFGNGVIDYTSAIWCDSKSCDDYNVFAIDQSATLVDMEVKNVNVTEYNYGSDYNILNTEVILKYNTNQETTKKLWELEDAEIALYDPFATGEQIVYLTYEDVDIAFRVTNPVNFPLGYEYEEDEQLGGIVLTKYIDNGLNIGKIIMPLKLDEKLVVALKSNTLEKSLVFGDSTDYSKFNSITFPFAFKYAGDYSLYGNNASSIVFETTDSIELGKYALSNSKNLIEVNGEIGKIAEGAFKEDTKLRDIDISLDIDNIPAYAFEECHNLLEINIPNVEEIGDKAFYNAERLKDVTLGLVDSYMLESIGDSSFEGTAIKELRIPSSVKTIGSKALARTKLESLYIPASVEELGYGFIDGSNNLASIVVDNANTKYDSHDNANGIIDSETNILIKGIKNTIIPEDVTIIGEEAYAYSDIKSIVIPNQIEEIKDKAFYEANSLIDVTIKRNVKKIGTNAFTNTPASGSGGIANRINFHVYFDSYAKDYAKNNKINYDTLAPSTVFVSRSKTVFEVFSTVKSSDISFITLYYAFGENVGNVYSESTEYNGKPFDFTGNYTISYSNGDSFRLGDTYYTLSGVDTNGEAFSTKVIVTVTKANASFEIPTGLEGTFGDKISTVTLPKGFSWNEPNQIMNKSGDVTFKATYTPDDTNNYNIDDDVSIVVHVPNPRTEIIPDIIINAYEYNGLSTVDVSNITVYNLDDGEYTIESATLTNVNVGRRKVSITLKLSDEKYQNYSLAEGQQVYTYEYSVNITPKKITKPTVVQKDYTYSGSSQVLELNNFDSSYMTITGNERTNAGSQECVIKLKSTNYAWSDETTDNLKFTFTIDKANVEYNYDVQNIRVIYDEESHGISATVTTPENYQIRYMDSNGNYTLEESPKYKDVGSYTIKFKIYIDDNHNDVYGEATLVILGENIVYDVSTFEGLEDGNDHTIEVRTEDTEAVIKYSLDGKNYNLDTPPKYKSPGEYKIYFKISASGYTPVENYSTVKIYGLKTIGSYGTLYNNIVLLDKNDYKALKNSFNIYANNYNVYHLDQNKKGLNDDILRTGDYVRIDILNGTKIIDYQISFVGDANGDGKISSLDYVRIKNKIMGSTNITGDAFIKAADANKDGKISSLDYVRIKNRIMEGDR